VSRAEDEPQYRIPDAPRLGRAIRAALSDFYFNSWRLVPANLLWGLGLLVVFAGLFTVPLAALPFAMVLALPTVGIFRLASLIVRERPVALSDALGAWRSYFGQALLVGAALVIITAVLGFNVIVGLFNPEPVLWIIATLAAWGLLATWVVALPFWALLTDPLRDEDPLRERLRLAALLVIISPLRFGGLWLLMTILLIVSTIFFAALLTISIAIIALVVTRYTLPAADRLQRRLTQALPG